MRKYLLLLIFLAAIPRLAFLNVIPAGINFEEIDYILNAKTVYQAWTDISGQWNPLSLSTPPADEPRGELLPLIIAPIIGPLPFSLFNSRLPFALFGILTVILVYFLSRKLFNEEIGKIAGIVAAINPWLIFSSRLGYDVPTSATFYLLTFVILLYGRGFSILLAIPTLFLGFHTYIGAKIILLPFTLIAIWYCWREVSKKQFSRYYLLVLLFAFLIPILFLLRLHSLPANIRATNFFTPNHQDVIDLVNNQRRLGLTINPSLDFINSIYVNRLTVYFKAVMNRILGAFSFPLLFVSGDVYSAYFLWDHGIFYYSDAIFMLVGFYILIRKYPRTAKLVGLFFSVFLIPAIVSGTGLSYVYRSYLLYTLLTIIVGLGIWTVLFRFPRKAKILLSVLVLIYFGQFLNFAQDYLVRNPVYHDSQFQLTHRVVVRYLIEEAKNGHQILVVGADPDGLMRQYVIYSGLFGKLADPAIRSQIGQRFRDQKYFWENITFTNDCGMANLSGAETVVWRYDKYCQTIDELRGTKPVSIARISDSGEDFKIYFGRTCDYKKLPDYIRDVKFGDLAIEKLPLDQFCKTYFVKGKDK